MSVDFSTQIAKFRNAVYGEEVRDSLVTIAQSLQSAINSQLLTVDGTLSNSGAGGDAKIIGDNFAATFDPTRYYYVGEYCKYNGRLCRCWKKITTPGAWTGSANWMYVTVGEKFYEFELGVKHIYDDLAPEFSTSSTYAVGDYCSYGERLCRCWKAVTSPGEFTGSANWIYVVISDKLEEFEQNDQHVFEDLAEEFSANKTYYVGSYVLYNGRLCRCWKAVTSPGEWTASANWAYITIGEKLFELEISGVKHVYADIADEFSTSSTYAVGDYAIYNDRLCKCHTAVTSPGEWTASANWVYVTIAAQLEVIEDGLSDNTTDISHIFQNLAAEFDPTHYYFVGDCCLYNGRLCRCHTAVSTPGPWTASANWEYVIIGDKLTELERANKHIYENLAPEFSTSHVYAVGEYVTYNERLCRCHTAVTTAGAWTGSSNWVYVTVGDQLEEIEDALQNNSYSLTHAFENTAEFFSSSSTYEVGDYCLYGERLCRCHTAVTTAGAWTGSANWAYVVLGDKLSELETRGVDTTLTISGQGADAKNVGDNLADTFSTTKTYSVGDYCKYNGRLCRCHTAVTTPGAWTASTNWMYVTIGDKFSSSETDVNDLKSALTNTATSLSTDYTNEMVNGYITIGTVDIGGTIDPTIRSGSYKTIDIPCKAGDGFLVFGNGYSGNAPRIWAFTDTAYTLLAKAENRESLNYAVLSAPSDGHAIFTFMPTTEDYSVRKVIQKTDPTMTESGRPADAKVVGDDLNALNISKTTNCFPYCGDYSWNISGSTCALTINSMIRVRFDTTNAAVDTTKDAFLAIAQASGIVTVSNGVVSGTHYAIIFDFTTKSIKVMDTSIATIYRNSAILFYWHYGVIGGMLVNNHVALDVSQNTTDIADIQAQLDDDLADYFVTEAETCKGSLIADCGEKAFVIAFTTDNHYGASNGMNFPTTVKTIKKVNALYPIDIVIDGGDLINGDETKANATNRMCSAVSMLCGIKGNAYTILGNHDDDSFTSSELPLFSKDELYAMMCRHEGVELDYVDGAEQYGYKDFPQYGLRLIVLDSMWGANGHVNADWGYSDAELAWFTSDALNTNNQVVIFSHMGFTKEYSAYNYQVKNGAEMRQAVESFIANGGVCVGLFHGHTHWDYIGQYSQTNGFHEVSTGCGRVVSGPITNRTDYYPSGATMPERANGTVTQELWDIIVIKPESRGVNMIRFGAGSDRSFTY